MPASTQQDETTKAHRASLKVTETAEKLERHIRACGLKPGDRYITTEEAGRMLGQSAVMAQRAMALLAERNILERRPRAGTFIGKAAVSPVHLSCLHFLLPENTIAERNPSESYWGQIQGIRSVLPKISVQFNFIPNQNVEHTRQIIEQAAESGSLTGVIVSLSSRSMRSFFNQSGIPTVVEGGIEPDLNNLCWIDWDQAQMGELLTRYLLERGHRRMVTIMRDIWSMGEPLLHDGIGAALQEADLPSGALRIRSVPCEQPAISELVRDLLQNDPTPPTAFLCRTEFQASCVSEVIDALGLSETVEVAICHAAGSEASRRHASVLPDVDTVEQGRIIGTMLQQLIDRNPSAPRGQKVAVRLLEPQR